MRKIIGLLLITFCMILIASGCASQEGASNQNNTSPVSQNDRNDKSNAEEKESFTITLATTEPNDHNVTMGAEKFKEVIESKSEGRIQVDLYPNLQLGSLRDQVEMTQMGSIQITTSPLSTVSSFVSDLAVMELPFLFNSEDEMWGILDGETGIKVLETIESTGNGLKGLGLWAGGFKQITTNTKPITSPDDLKGLKIRVIPSDALIKQYKTWGANPTPIDFAELYTALQQGTVDAQENPLTTIVSKKFYEVQDYLTISDHAYQFHVFLVNEDWFTGLSQEDQQLIIEAEKEARLHAREINAQRTEENLKILKDVGMEINILSDESKDEFRQLSSELYEEVADNDVKKSILEAIQNEVN